MVKQNFFKKSSTKVGWLKCCKRSTLRNEVALNKMIKMIRNWFFGVNDREVVDMG